MSQWETCEIKLIWVREGKSGIFKSTSPICRWEAQKTSPSGLETIFKSREFDDPTWHVGEDKFDKLNEEKNAAYQQLIAQLANEGWEPASTSQGWVSLMKRRIGGGSIQTTKNPVDLLQQLANLRDASILTEQEFQTKKAEILKRM